jgi:hypothetical protein
MRKGIVSPKRSIAARSAAWRRARRSAGRRWWRLIVPANAAHSAPVIWALARATGVRHHDRKPHGPGSWALESRGHVVVCCPKCSTDVCIPKGQREARAVCHVCGVWWTEDTTVVPFVPRYG